MHIVLCIGMYNMTGSLQRTNLYGSPLLTRNSLKTQSSSLGPLRRSPRLSTTSMSSLKTLNLRLPGPSYLPSSSMQLALNKSLWDEQSEEEMGGQDMEHHLSLGRWSQAFATPERGCLYHAQRMLAGRRTCLRCCVLT